MFIVWSNRSLHNQNRYKHHLQHHLHMYHHQLSNTQIHNQQWLLEVELIHQHFRNGWQINIIMVNNLLLLQQLQLLTKLLLQEIQDKICQVIVRQTHQVHHLSREKIQQHLNSSWPISNIHNKFHLLNPNLLKFLHHKPSNLLPNQMLLHLQATIPCQE